MKTTKKAKKNEFDVGKLVWTGCPKGNRVGLNAKILEAVNSLTERPRFSRDVLRRLDAAYRKVAVPSDRLDARPFKLRFKAALRKAQRRSLILQAEIDRRQRELDRLKAIYPIKLRPRKPKPTDPYFDYPS